MLFMHELLFSFGMNKFLFSMFKIGFNHTYALRDYTDLSLSRFEVNGLANVDLYSLPFTEETSQNFHLVYYFVKSHYTFLSETLFIADRSANEFRRNIDVLYCFVESH